MNIAFRTQTLSYLVLAVFACCGAASPAARGSSEGKQVQEDPLLKTIAKDADAAAAKEGRSDEVSAESPIQRMELNKQVQEDPLLRPDFGADPPGAAAKPSLGASKRHEQQESGSVEGNARVPPPATQPAPPPPPSPPAEESSSSGSEAPTADDAAQKAAARDCMRDHCDDKSKQAKDNKVQEDPLLKVIEGRDRPG